MASTHDLTVVADGFSFLEGPRWRNGKLYMSDFYHRRVLSVDAAGKVEVVVEVAGQPSGLGFDPDGNMLIVSMTDRRLLRLRGGKLEEVADLSRLAPFHCNDMFVDDDGRAFIGNYGWDPGESADIQDTCLITVSPDGRAEIAAQGLVFPNGIAKDLDGRLVVAETFAGRVSAYDLAPDGTLSNRVTWADFAGRPLPTLGDSLTAGVPLPDGIAMDAEGFLWIADAGGHAALRVAPGGQIVDRVEVGDLCAFTVALGGPAGDTLYICAAPPLTGGDHEAECLASMSARLLSCRAPAPAI